MDVAVGLKLLPDFETAVNEMTHLGETFEPNPECHEMYSELYERVYRQMYKQLKPLYHEISQILQRRRPGLK